MRIYTPEDCEHTGKQISFYQKVVVYSGKTAKTRHNQLFLCLEKDSPDPEHQQAFLDLVSLSDGERYFGQREDIIGTLKPELLPDEAKLNLSQICRHESKDFHKMEPLYSGYSFLPDGRYAAGVWLCSPQEVMDYVETQKPYQSRVLICDRDDFAVMEVVNGQTIFPSPEEVEKFWSEQARDGGMTMT